MTRQPSRSELRRRQQSINRIRIEADRLARAEERLNTAVERSRRAGVSWSEVGQVLGVTKQAAHQRFLRTFASGAVNQRLLAAAQVVGSTYVQPDNGGRCPKQTLPAD